MTNLQDLIIGRFISRADVLALQKDDGSWYPARQHIPNVPYNDLPFLPWSREILQDHLDGKLTAGHYLLGQDSTTKLIAFDIDFQHRGHLPTGYDNDGMPKGFEITNLREAWHDRSNPHRTWMKAHLRQIVHKIAAVANQELEIPVAAAYSGNKGVHVYGFTDTMPAADARIAGNLVMKTLETFELTRGSFEWTDTNPDLESSFSNMTVEVFPKQDEINGEGLGNLMSLPLGVNRKHPTDPKFFLDLRSPVNELVPVDPEWALSTTDPWKD